MAQSGIKRCLFSLVVFSLVYLHFSPLLYATGKVIQIQETDLITLENGLQTLESELMTQKELSSVLKSQLIEAETQLTSASEHLSELEKSINKELSKKLWIGVGIGVGVSAVIAVITLLATAHNKN